MRNYKNLHVWEKAHTLTLAVYKDTQQFPSEERFGLTKSDPALMFFHSCESGGGLWQEMGWRDGSLRPDRNGLRRRALVSPLAVEGSRPAEDRGLRALGFRTNWSHAHVVFAFAKTEKRSGVVGFKPKPNG